jgi:FkbM family methyltransferase
VIGLSVIPGLKRSRVGHILNRVNLVGLLQRVFAEHRVSHVLDVGANLGQYVTFLRKHIGYRGGVTSFEPTSAAFAVLQATAKSDPSWRVLRLALGDTDTEATINVMEGSDLSSLHAPSVEWTSEFSNRNAVSKTETVKVRRLDGLSEIPQGAFYLKVDTQGHDLAVLDGASGVLDRVAACQIEVPCIRLYEGCPTMTECLTYMDEHGFDVCGLFPVSTISHERVIDFDGVFVNRRAL